MISRWVSLVLCLVLLVVVVPTVRSADNLVLNPSFLDPESGGVIPNWDRGSGADADIIAAHDGKTESLAPTCTQQHGCVPIAYYQCIDTSSLVASVYVGGSIWATADDAGSIQITMHADQSECESGQALDDYGGFLAITMDDVEKWMDLSETYTLPDQETTYVRITLTGLRAGEIYFDDIYATEVPTAVTLTRAEARSNAMAAAMWLSVLIGVPANYLLRRRRQQPT